MARELRRIATFVLGWALVVLGVAGLFLPFLQGILLILVGLWVLSRESRWASAHLARLRRRYPRVSDSLERLKRKLPFRHGGHDDGEDARDRSPQSTTTAGTKTGSSEPLSTTDA